MMLNTETATTTPPMDATQLMEQLTNTTELLHTTSHPTEQDVSIGGFYTMAIALTIICLLGMVLNSSTLLVLSKRQNPQRIEFLIKVLLMSDLMMCMLSLPFSITSSFAGRWLFGSVGCHWYGFSMFFTGVFSINILTAICVERYFTVKQTVQVPESHKTKVLVTSLVVSALGALVWSLLPLMGVSSYRLEGLGATCSIDWQSKRPQDQAYLVVILICCFVAPLSVIVFCYSHIYIKVTSRPWATKLTRQSQLSQRRIKTELHLAKTIFFTSGCFILAWSPYSVVSLMAIFTDPGTIPPVVISISSLFAKSSIFFNSFVYVFMNHDLRLACLQNLGMRRNGAANQQDPALSYDHQQCNEFWVNLPRLTPRDPCFKMHDQRLDVYGKAGMKGPPQFVTSL